MLTYVFGPAPIERRSWYRQRKYGRSPVFKSVSTKVDFPAMERETLRWWYDDGVVEAYLKRNDTVHEALVVPRRADHRQQPDGRPPRLGPHLQGPLPALPHHARRNGSATRTASTARGCGSRSRSRRSSASPTSATSRPTASTDSSSAARSASGNTPASRPSSPSASATAWTGTTPTTRCPTRTTTPSGAS